MYFAENHPFAEILIIARNDFTSGSKTIARRLLHDALELINENQFSNSDLLEFSRCIKAMRPSMTILGNIGNYLEDNIKINVDSYATEIESLLTELDNSDAILLDKTQRLFQISSIKRIMTHSRSSTVENILLSLGRDGTIDSVVCTESQPQNEGVNLARSLSEAVTTTIIRDSLASTLLTEVDCLLLGADTIDEDGNILNKIGSRDLAIGAKKQDVPVICVAESLKICKAKTIYDIPIESQPVYIEDDSEGKNSDMIIFESVESELISSLILDKEEG